MAFYGLPQRVYSRPSVCFPRFKMPVSALKLIISLDMFMDQIIEFSTNHWPMVVSFAVLLALALNMEFKRSGAALNTHELTAKINAEDALVVDVRESKDFKAGHIVDSLNVPLIKVDSEIKNLEKHKARALVVVCQLGQHSGQAVRKLEEAGFEKVYRLSGGISAWRGENLPLIKS